MASGTLALGDVVAFRLPTTGRMLIHRVIRTEGGRATLKGDNLSESDGDLPLEALLGRVTCLARAGRVVRLPGRLWCRFLVILSRGGVISRWNWIRPKVFALGASLASRMAGFVLYRRCAGVLLPSPVVSDAQQEDKAALESIWGELPGLGSETVVFVAKVCGRTAGYAGLTAGAREAKLFGPVVRARYQGRGAGVALIRLAVAHADQEGLVVISAQIPTDARLMGLLEREGFRFESESHSVVQGSGDVLVRVHSCSSLRGT